MAVWTDAYCFVDQCLLYERGKPQAWWMYGPESDSQFTESASGIVSICLYLFFPKRSVLRSNTHDVAIDGFQSRNETVMLVHKSIANRPFSNSHGWTGSSMKWRLMQAKLFKCKLICLHEPPFHARSSPTVRIRNWPIIALVLRYNRVKYPKDFCLCCSVHQRGCCDVR